MRSRDRWSRTREHPFYLGFFVFGVCSIGYAHFHSIKVTEQSDTQIVITAGPHNRAVIVAQPFRIDFYQNDVLTVSANAKGLMRFEHTRSKATP